MKWSCHYRILTFIWTAISIGCCWLIWFLIFYYPGLRFELIAEVAFISWVVYWITFKDWSDFRYHALCWPPSWISGLFPLRGIGIMLERLERTASWRPGRRQAVRWVTCSLLSVSCFPTRDPPDIATFATDMSPIKVYWFKMRHQINCVV